MALIWVSLLLLFSYVFCGVGDADQDPAPLSCTQDTHSLSLRYIVSPHYFLTISLPTRENMSRSKSWGL